MAEREAEVRAKNGKKKGQYIKVTNCRHIFFKLLIKIYFRLQ